MSDTIREDRDGNKRKEGLHKKQKTHVCRCEYCTGVSKNLSCEKIAEKEMKEEIRTVISGENIDFTIEKQDEILEQIMGRN